MPENKTKYSPTDLQSSVMALEKSIGAQLEEMRNALKALATKQLARETGPNPMYPDLTSQNRVQAGKTLGMGAMGSKGGTAREIMMQKGWQ